MAFGEDLEERKIGMDLGTAEFYGRVRDAYHGIAKREPERFKLIDANGSVDETQALVGSLVSDFLNIK